MERKIGEVFTYDGKTYQVVKSILCAFRGKLCGLIGPSAGNCMPNSRSDNTSVIFKEIKDIKFKAKRLDTGLKVTWCVICLLYAYVLHIGYFLIYQ